MANFGKISGMVGSMPIPPPPPVLTSNPVGQPSPASPPSPEAAPPDFSSILNHKPKRGGLSLDLIASIQKMYADEAAKNMPPQGAVQKPQVGLEPGWGGQGR
jgi:hypothetical protein